MELEDFINFINKTIKELILYGEMHSGNDYSDYDLVFKWGTNRVEIVEGLENIIYEIADKVYVSSDKIFPCVDLILEQPNNEKILQITGRIAGYEAKEFGIGWSNRPGPFIYGIGRGIKNRKVNTETSEFKKKLIDMGLLFEH